MTSSSDDFFASLPRKRMGSGVLFADPTYRVLLVEPTYKDDWETPGGSVEADESPFQAAQREVKEELGLAITPGRLLVIDWVATRPGRTEGVMFLYAGETLSSAQQDDIELPADELRSWAWCTEPEAETRLSEFLARRVRAAVNALRQGTTSYLENGHPIA